jgi:GntR family transcriptional repressor for pyruvate dehydrogenase complex
MAINKDPLQHLREQIASGRLPKHSKLPPERELAKQFGIPRTAIRRALSILEAEGEIRRYIGRGTYVGGMPENKMERRGAESWSTSPSEIIEVRLYLEPRLAGAAALRATSEDIENMYHCLEKFEAATDWETHQLWDNTLHQTIANAAQNSLLSQIMDEISNLRKSKDWKNLQKSTLKERRKQAVEFQHRAVVDAILERDPKRATKAMQDHLISVDKILKAAAEAQPEDTYLQSSYLRESAGRMRHSNGEHND